MKLHRNGKPWLCAAKEAGRYGTEHPFLITLRDGTRAIAATDGRRLVLLPVECEEGDVDGVVTRDALAAAVKAVPNGGRAPEVRCNGGLEVLFGPTFPRPELDGRSFPDVESVVPMGEPEYRITFNARYLAEVAQAMGTDSVTVELHGADAPMIVLPDPGVNDAKPVPGARGLLMPIGPEKPPSSEVQRARDRQRKAEEAAGGAS